MAGGRAKREHLAKRGKGKGKGKGRNREASEASHDSSSGEIWKDQAFVSSPVLHRYATRHSRAATLAQSATSNPPLPKPIRFINKQKSPENLIQNATSASNFSSIPHNTIFVPTNFGDFQSNKKYKGVSNVGNSDVAGSAQGSQHVEGIDPASSFNMTEYVRKQQEDFGESYGNRPEKSTNNGSNSQGLSRCHSLNITEYAKKLQDDIEDDPVEVESAVDPAFGRVYGHIVRKDIVPRLESIFDKYGDITVGCHSKPSNYISYDLERVCDIYERLRRTRFHDITRIDLRDMLEEVDYLESQKLKVGWLRAKLEYISETKTNLLDYLSIKEEAAKDEACIGIWKEKLKAHQRELANLQEKMADVQEKISAEEEELRAIEAKSEQSKKRVLDTKAGVMSLVDKGLVHGLL